MSVVQEVGCIAQQGGEGSFMTFSGRWQGEEGIGEERVCGCKLVGWDEDGGFWARSGESQLLTVHVPHAHLQLSKGILYLISAQCWRHRLPWSQNAEADVG